LSAPLDPVARRVLHWSTAALATGGAQVGVQALAFVAGLLVIRLLTPEQYAYYTIASTAAGSMAVVMDSGLCLGVLAQGGRVWQDRAQLGGVIRSALRLWRLLAALVLTLSVPAVWGLLRHQGANAGAAAITALAVMPLVLATTSGLLFEAVPRLHQALRPLQLLQLIANGGRVLVLAALLPFAPLAAVATAGAALPQWWLNRRLRRLAAPLADYAAPIDPAANKALRRQVLRSFPTALYFGLSGQLTTWLISIFGVAASVASVGALARLAALLTALGTGFNVFAVPRFARLPAWSTGLVFWRFWQAQGALALVCCIPLALVATFPGEVLSILGPAYRGLESEAILMTTGSVLWTVGGAAYTLAAARGVVTPAWVVVPYSILVQIALVLLLPLGTIRGVIVFGALVGASQWLLYCAYFVWSHRLNRSAG
jgi:hypothetical protein